MVTVPDRAECFRLMDEYGMLPNIRRHSVMVARVALQIVEGLRKAPEVAPEAVDRELIIAGALLHDIAKTPCLKNGGDHARVGAEICEELGYPAVAKIVGEHVLLRCHDAARRRRGCFSAREVIYYADKRVRHEEIVSLEDRLEYILHHYGLDDPGMHRRIRENFARCVELEEYLFRYLPFAPEELAGLVADRAAGRSLEQISLEGVDE